MIRQFAMTWLLAALCIGAQAQSLSLTHVHGLAYSADGRQLVLPSHHGLAVFRDGKWSKAPGPQHDYMGFAATAKYLYSSGHPAPGSGLINPFGLIRSKDGGKSWEKLGLEGETDFHLLAVGWNNNAIYVWNPAPSSRMRETGLHLTLDEGRAWKPARAAGLAGKPSALAVHPEAAAIVAVATSSGVYLSRDSGDHFVPLAGGIEALSLHFDLDGKRLWYGAFDGAARLAMLPLDSGKATPSPLPKLGRDAVAYIAQNPTARSEYAIASFERSVYVSKDGGRTWRSIAEHGVGK